jgi:sulfite exporter TauE/SafE
VTEHLLIFLAGLAGSMHCIGMCGGFACALGADPRGRSATLQRHLIYNIGRVTSYCFLGAVVGHLGVLLIGHDGEGSAGSAAQRALAVVSGLLMIAIGARFFGGAGTRRDPLRVVGAEPLARALRSLLRAPGAGAPLAFGVLNGFLPCPLVYAFAAQAAAGGSALAGLQVMAAFGLGTFAAMLAIGGAGLWWRARVAAPRQQPVQASFLPAPRAAAAGLEWRVHGVRLAGGCIVLLGLITVARGVVPMSAHWH